MWVLSLWKKRIAIPTWNARSPHHFPSMKEELLLTVHVGCPHLPLLNVVSLSGLGASLTDHARSP